MTGSMQVVNRISGKKITLHKPPAYNPQPQERAHVEHLLSLANQKGASPWKHGNQPGSDKADRGSTK